MTEKKERKNENNLQICAEKLKNTSETENSRRRDNFQPRKKRYGLGDGGREQA